MSAFLDWAAGAPLHPAARAAFEGALGAANPSSVHGPGRAARALLEKARAQVAALVGCQPREIVFTSSATEANAAAVRGGPVVIGAVEHPSVRLAAAMYGRAVREARADVNGVVGPDAVREAIDFQADVVALQLANNETGVIQPVIEAAALAREAGARFHCDAVQGAGKLELSAIWSRCDSMALSAHKLGGVPGVGALALRRGVELPALIPGHQERGLRGGTPALPLIAAFGAVAELWTTKRIDRLAALGRKAARLEQILTAAGARVNGAAVPRVPGIVSATFPGVDGETLLVALDLAGIACSHGAACSTGAMEPSHVLLAMGMTPAEARSTIRFSVGPETADEELELLARVLPAALARQR